MIFVIVLISFIVSSCDSMKISNRNVIPNRISPRVPMTISIPKTQNQRNSMKSNKLVNTIAIAASILAFSDKAKASVDDKTLLTVKSKKPVYVNDGSNDFAAGLVSGAASRIGKEIILHPIDTIRARQQIPLSINSSDPVVGLVETVKDLYSGVGPALIGGIPAGALFFGVKDYTKGQLRNAGVSKISSTLLSVVAANIPFWLIKTPTEVLKTRQQIGEKNEANINSLISLYNNKGGSALYESLYSSYISNLAYALPSDIVKFLAYESLLSLAKIENGAKVDGFEAAFLGSLASLLAQTTTTPLDVARTRIMSQATSDLNKSNNPIEVLKTAIDNEGISVLFAGLGPRSFRAICSGGIQFASYELAQNMFSKSRSIE